MLETASPERKRNARSRIYRTAVRLFAEAGKSDISISDLAQAAGMARGTVYNNLDRPENLFGDVVSMLSREMLERTELAMSALTDPVERLATGIRLFVRRAHEEHDWGRFLVSFAASHEVLTDMMRQPPARDLERAIATGKFKLEAEKLPALVSMLGGSTLAAMKAVIEGERAWREAGSDIAELFLRAGGVSPGEARRVAQRELPPLPPAPAKPKKTARRGKP